MEFTRLFLPKITSGLYCEDSSPRLFSIWNGLNRSMVCVGQTIDSYPDCWAASLRHSRYPPGSHERDSPIEGVSDRSAKCYFSDSDETISPAIDKTTMDGLTPNP